MKKSVHHIFLHIGLIGSMAFNSCERFLDVPLPDSQFSSDIVFDTKQTAEGAMSNIYITQQRNLLSREAGPSTFFGLLTDELASPQLGNSTRTIDEIYEASLSSQHTSIQTMWSNGYNLIYQCNNMLEGLNKTTMLDDQLVISLKGSTLFIRAMTYFQLVYSFGDIPYLTTSGYQYNSRASRDKAEKVGREIIRDLKMAETMLPATYPTAFRAKPIKATAQALLARAYLYQGNWDSAYYYSDLVIKNPLFQVETDIKKAFLKENRSTIWQYKTPEAGGNSGIASIYSFAALGSPSIQPFLSEGFYNAFEQGDLRKVEWIRTSVGTLGQIWRSPLKYKEASLTTPDAKEYYIRFRLEEMHLIRAEAAVYLNQEPQALKDINITRKRAGLELLELVGKDVILAAILKERRFELATEEGHRYFDLKRFGKLETTMKPVKPNWKSHYNLLPVPQSEILLNQSLLPQNPSY